MNPGITSAMLLCAGLGTRLRPLSDTLPKALFPVLNQSMLSIWFERLHLAGIRHIVINTHYKANLVEKAAQAEAAHFGLKLTISHEELILGTGGGLKKACVNFSSPFFVVNCDIYMELDLLLLAQTHFSCPKTLATLAVIDWPSKATVSLGEGDKIVGFRSPIPLPGELAKWCGTGLMVLDPVVLSDLSPGPSDIIDHLNGKIAQNLLVRSLRCSGIYWRDMGTVSDYYALNRDLTKGRIIADPTASLEGQTTGFVVAGAGSKVALGAGVTDSILWPGAHVSENLFVSNAVITKEHGPVNGLIQEI